MDGEITSLDSPIDAMYLIHKALRAEATRAEKAVEELEISASLQGFRLVFNTWATALVFHAEKEDLYITEPLINGGGFATVDSVGKSDNAVVTQFPPAGNEPGLSHRIRAAMLAQEDELHRELLESVENVLSVLNEEIGRTSIITRTKQHLYGEVVTLRIVQDDHLDTEETVVLPLVRESMDEREQLKVARGLLIDDSAQDERWLIDWVERALSPCEQKLLANLEARFKDLPAAVPYG